MLRLSKEEVNPVPRHSRPSPLPAPVPRHSKSPSFCSPLSFLSPLSHSHVSLYVIPAKAGIQSLFPLRNALMLGAWPAGRPGPFLWIPAKNGGNDRRGNGGKDRGETAGRIVCHSRESGNPESFPLRNALVLGAWPAGRPGPFLWIPAKNCGNDRREPAGMTGGEPAGMTGGKRRE